MSQRKDRIEAMPEELPAARRTAVERLGLVSIAEHVREPHRHLERK